MTCETSGPTESQCSLLCLSEHLRTFLEEVPIKSSDARGKSAAGGDEDMRKLPGGADELTGGGQGGKPGQQSQGDETHLRWLCGVGSSDSGRNSVRQRRRLVTGSLGKKDSHFFIGFSSCCPKPSPLNKAIL